LARSEEGLKEKDLKITYSCGSGPGGQHQNRTMSAVKIVHLPTGETVSINGRKQRHNEKLARQIIASKVQQLQELKTHSSYSNSKRNQLDGNGRGNKRRTYNYIKGFIKDHKSGKSTQKIKQFMKGNLELVI